MIIFDGPKELATHRLCVLKTNKHDVTGGVFGVYVADGVCGDDDAAVVVEYHRRLRIGIRSTIAACGRGGGGQVNHSWSTSVACHNCDVLGGAGKGGDGW